MFMLNIVYPWIPDSVLDPWKEDFEEGGLKHDLVMKDAKLELGGDYMCEAIKYPDVYSFDVEVNVIGVFSCCFILWMN